MACAFGFRPLKAASFLKFFPAEKYLVMALRLFSVINGLAGAFKSEARCHLFHPETNTLERVDQNPVIGFPYDVLSMSTHTRFDIVYVNVGHQVQLIHIDDQCKMRVEPPLQSATGSDILSVVKGNYLVAVDTCYRNLVPDHACSSLNTLSDATGLLLVPSPLLVRPSYYLIMEGDCPGCSWKLGQAYVHYRGNNEDIFVTLAFFMQNTPVKSSLFYLDGSQDLIAGKWQRHDVESGTHRLAFSPTSMNRRLVFMLNVDDYGLRAYNFLPAADSGSNFLSFYLAYKKLDDATMIPRDIVIPEAAVSDNEIQIFISYAPKSSSASGGQAIRRFIYNVDRKTFTEAPFDPPLPQDVTDTSQMAIGPGRSTGYFAMRYTTTSGSVLQVSSMGQAGLGSTARILVEPISQSVWLDYRSPT